MIIIGGRDDEIAVFLDGTVAWPRGPGLLTRPATIPLG
jgi:hypothetical protein